MLELPQNVVETSPAYRVLAQTVENLKRDATEARTAEADYRSQLDVYLAQRHAFVEEMEVRCRTAAAIVEGLGPAYLMACLPGGARVGTAQKQKGAREGALEAELRLAQNELVRLRFVRMPAFVSATTERQQVEAHRGGWSIPGGAVEQVGPRQLAATERVDRIAPQAGGAARPGEPGGAGACSGARPAPGWS